MLENLTGTDARFSFPISCISGLPAIQICKYDIEQSISREMSGDLKNGMLAVGRSCIHIYSKSGTENPIMLMVH